MGRQPHLGEERVPHKDQGLGRTETLQLSKKKTNSLAKTGATGRNTSHTKKIHKWPKEKILKILREKKKILREIHTENTKMPLHTHQEAEITEARTPDTEQGGH